MTFKPNNKKDIRICFVCTDNFARSLIGEYCLKKYAEENDLNYLKSSSAGINTNRDTSKFCFVRFDELKRIGVDVSNHKRTQLTKEIVDSASLIVAMAEHHQQWIKENFNVDVPMFSEIIGNKKISYRVPPPPSGKRETVLRKMVHEIYNTMPIFVKNIDNWLGGKS